MEISFLENYFLLYTPIKKIKYHSFVISSSLKNSSPLQRAAASPDDLAAELTAHLEQKKQQYALIARIMEQYADQPCVQKVVELDTRIRSLIPDGEMNLTKEDFFAFVEYRLLAMESAGTSSLDPFFKAFVLEQTKAYINRLLPHQKTDNYTREGFDQLINKINSFVGSLMTGRSRDELLKSLTIETKRDCCFNGFIASCHLADSILDLLTDPSNLEITFSQFTAFCKKQRQASQSPTPDQLQASMEEELADLLQEDEERARKKSAKKESRGTTSSTSPLLGSAMRVSAVSPNLPLSPSSMQRSFGSNPLLNKSFGSRPSRDDLLLSPSPISSTAAKKHFHVDPHFDSRPGVKKVPIKAQHCSASKQGHEGFVDRILSNPTLPVFVNDHVERWNLVQTLDEVRAFPDLSSKGGPRYAEMQDSQIREQILHHDATMIDSLFQSELFRKHYTRCVSDRYYLFKVKLEPEGQPAPQEWTIATVALSERQELVHFYCHDIKELQPSQSNAKESLISKLFPAINSIDLRRNSAAAAQAKEVRPKRHLSLDTITAVPQENGPPLLKVLRQHPLTGPSTLWIAPILK